MAQAQAGSPIVVDIDGVPETFPAGTPLPEIQKQAMAIRHMRQSPTSEGEDAPLTLGTVRDQYRKGDYGGIAKSVMSRVATPENAALLASMAVGPEAGLMMRMGAPAATAAATEAGREKFLHGQDVNPYAVANRGVLNAIPGAVEGAARAAGPSLAKVAGGVVTGGAKGGILAALKSVLGVGESTAPAVGEGLELYGRPGVSIQSHEGAEAAKQHAIEQLKYQGPDSTQSQAAHDLWRKLHETVYPADAVADAAQTARLPLGTLAKSADFPVVTAADRAATIKAAIEKQGRARGQSISLRLRQALGLGSVLSDDAQ